MSGYNLPDNVSAADPYFDGVSDKESDMMDELAALERAQEAYRDMATELSSTSLGPKIVYHSLLTSENLTFDDILADIETAMQEQVDALKQELGVDD